MIRQARFIFAYILFPVGTVLFTVLVLLPFSLLVKNYEKRRIVAAAGFRSYLLILRLLGLCSIEVLGRPVQAASVTIYNHPTLFDALLAIVDQPTACCVIKEKVEKSWIYGLGASLLGYITAEDGGEVVKRGVAQIRQGNSVIIFPEGTRVASGIGKLHRSAARLALEARAPISIGVISCNPPVLNRSSKLFDGPKSKVEIKLRYLPPISTNIGVDAIGIQSRRLTEKIEEIFRQQLS